MKKMMTLVLALVMTATLFAGCGAAKSDSDLKNIEKAGKIVVGITDYAPMDYKDENGEWTGFDAEFAEAFAAELGVACEFYEIADWGKKFMELETNQIDAVWNGMTITEEATSNSSVSDPYVVNAQVVVMKADAVANFADAASLAGLTIAVESGSAGEEAAAAVEGATIVPLQTQADALLEVAALQKAILQTSHKHFGQIGVSQRNFCAVRKYDPIQSRAGFTAQIEVNPNSVRIDHKLRLPQRALIVCSVLVHKDFLFRSGIHRQLHILCPRPLS